MKKTKKYGLTLVTALLFLFPATVSAGNTSITGGTNGPLCNSGGYFTPSSVSVTSGDTVTISVPSNDPYPGGLEVHGFPEGDFVILPGDSHTTNALTASVSYYATWPSSGCMKGTGSITVTTPPPVTPPPASTTSTPAAKSSAKTTTPAPVSTSTTTTPAPATTATPTSTETTTTPATPTIKIDTPVAKPQQAMTVSKVASFGAGAVVLLGLAVFMFWRRIARRHLKVMQPAPASPAAASPVAMAAPTPPVAPLPPTPPTPSSVASTPPAPPTTPQPPQFPPTQT